MSKNGIVSKVSGPLIQAKNMADVKVYDVVRVGNNKLLGEVIELRDDLASIQVYEETSGIGPGDPVYFTGEPLSVELAPGLIGGIFDGIQRPLNTIYEKSGDSIPRGIEVDRINREKTWEFKALVEVGALVSEGNIIAEVVETLAVTNKIMVPHGVSGVVTFIKKGKATITDCIIRIEDKNKEIHEIKMLSTWPVRKKRPYLNKIAPTKPMVTGQRVIDTLFPIAIGGIAAIPGPFGSGKTVVQHQLAKWADADIIVYIGCGERGNEMTDVLMEFPEIIDPKTKESIMSRTILIANTSNMPVAAREASIYTGITIAEYYRDMGYLVAIMADSTSRWAEALREMSSRLEEMPGEEGYPAYLASRLADFYERAGLVISLDGSREGAITAIGAISPPGGDTQEPVSQATLRIVKVFWGLSAQLAYRRHFPAIDWLRSYSLYSDVILDYFDNFVETEWSLQVRKINLLLESESSLQEIVRLVGIDSLSYDDRITLLIAQMIREDFLHQNAFHEVDTFTSIHKQFLIAKSILVLHDELLEAINNKKPFKALEALGVREQIGRFKYIAENNVDKEFKAIINNIRTQIDSLVSEE